MNACVISAYFENLRFHKKKNQQTSQKYHSFETALAYSSRRQKGNIIKYHAGMKTGVWH